MGIVAEEVLTESTALERAEEFIATIGEYPDEYHGRGIVMSGGGVRYFTNAWIAISLLRHVGCTLPVQLWYLGREELDAYMEELIAPLGVECIDATAIRAIHPARILRGWEVKPYAILHSPFREVMLLDADNFVAVDPTFLFESWEYRETGALFWPDVGRLAADHSSWRLFGVPYRDEPEFESGQIVVNKETCWKALCLTRYYNDWSDFYYRHVHGDKETFHFAFRKLDQAFAMPRHPMRLVDGTFFQQDFAGQLLFQHRNRAKWEFAADNPINSLFRHEAECRRFLEELRQQWDGSIGGPRQRLTRVDVLAARAALTSTVYRYVREGYGYWPMSFIGDGHIGIGSTDAERQWDVRLAGQSLSLEVSADARRSCTLAPDGSGWISASGDIALVPMPRPVGPSAHAPLSVHQFIERALTYAEPLSQNTGTQNLGFGWLYYGLARNYRPDFAIAIGSARGFGPLCVARGLQYNGCGTVIFIDPSYRGSGDPAWDGRGHWDHATEVEKWFDLFGLGGRVRHLKMRSDDALPTVREMVAGKYTGLLLIDGAHTHEQSLRDFDQYSALMSDGVALFHDATNPNCGVSGALRELRTRGLDVATLDLDVGLGIVPISRPPRVDDKWSYLTASSDRGALIMEHLRPLLRDGDQVFEAYCGFSPLNALYGNVRVFGFDLDPVVIERLRAEYPAHRWAQVEERQLPYADLPERCDVLVGLGLSHGYCSWDPQLVAPNLRYLVRQYRPRVCLFEAAADYHNAEILDAAAATINAVGYAHREAIIETSLSAYSRRRLLIGTAG